MNYLLSGFQLFDEMGRYKGGYALVKEISQMGGLKKVRQEYAEYMQSSL